MPTEQKMMLCKKCGRPTTHLATRQNNILHLLLSVFTLGLWLLVWLIVTAGRENPRCTVCGFETKEPNSAKGCLAVVLVIGAIFVWFCVKNWPTDAEIGIKKPEKIAPMVVYESSEYQEPIKKNSHRSSNTIHEASGDGWKVKVEYE